jgi:regulator of protease activity HflC (stomatin/prohibitin superfamily)
MPHQKPKLVGSIEAIQSERKLLIDKVDLRELRLPDEVREQLMRQQKAREETAAKAHLIRLG